MTLRVFEAFSGYGSQTISLRNLKIDYEVVGISEINEYAVIAYEAIHGPVNNLGDIRKINVEDIPEHDLFTYSFPCQDISVSGKRLGIERGVTRSGLLYECERIIEYCKPKYLLLENVKNLTGKKFKKDFDNWLEYLDSLGYTNYWKILNSKMYGVAQNRERVFVVSILGEHNPYEFLEPIPLTQTIKDILEEVVDDRYYIDVSKFDNFVDKKKHEDVYKEYLTYDASLKKYKTEYGNIYYNIDENSDKAYIEYKFDKIELPCIVASRGRNPDNPSDRTAGAPTQQRLEVNKNGTSNTITTVQKDNYVILEDFKIRKLTTRETFRLMGMNDSDIDKIQQAGISNSQQFKLAGNSIVINVLEAIFKNLF